MKRLAIAKIEFCRLAGSPRAIICLAHLTSNLSFPSDSRWSPFCRSSEIVTSSAERYCEIMLASATPATSSFTAMTKNRFSMTFTTPETKRKVSGFFVFPAAL